MRSLKIKIRDYFIVERRNGYTLKGIDRTPSEGRIFRLREVKAGVWNVNQTCLNGERKRKQFRAELLEEAIEQAESILYPSSGSHMNSNALIGECFAEWLASRSCSEETCERDYGSRIKLFLRWIDEQGLRYWRDLRLLHLQSYANHLVQTGKATRTIELQCRVVKMASKWAAQTWPEYFRDFAAGFRTPRQNRMVRYSERGGRAVLRLKDVGEFALWLREQGSGAHILPGILLQGLCSLRVREVLRLTWDNVDFEAGTVTVEGYVKNLQSVRRIPVPRIVLAALAETPREGPRLLAALKDQCSYGRAFRRNLRHWRPGFHIEPKGLRRTLVSEFFEYGWYGDVLQMYRGHQPSVSAIDWNHYIVYQPAKILEMFREQVVSRVDVLMEETLQKWLSVKGAEQVIPLPLLTASDR